MPIYDPSEIKREYLKKKKVTVAVVWSVIGM